MATTKFFLFGCASVFIAACASGEHSDSDLPVVERAIASASMKLIGSCYLDFEDERHDNDL